jgi:hypothetical protein
VRTDQREEEAKAALQTIAAETAAFAGAVNGDDRGKTFLHK